MHPVAPRTGRPEETLGEENRTGFQPITVAHHDDGAGNPVYVTRWTLTEAERALIAGGADLYVWQHGPVLQPMGVQVGPDAPVRLVCGGEPER